MPDNSLVNIIVISHQSPLSLPSRCPYSMLALVPQSGDSSGAALGVRSVALLHIAVFVARNHGYPLLNSPVVAVSLPCRCRVYIVVSR